MIIFTSLFWLLVSHAVCDFGLQNDYMASAKNPCNGHAEWWIVLAAHSAIHAGGVVLVTNNYLLGLAEFFAHLGIDHCKAYEGISYKTDQALHCLCKVCWIFFLVC